MPLAKLGNLERQVAVTLRALAEDQHMPGAIHGFERIVPVVLYRRKEHVGAVVQPVTLRLPKRALPDAGRVHLNIAGRLPLLCFGHHD